MYAILTHSVIRGRDAERMSPTLNQFPSAVFFIQHVFQKQRAPRRRTTTRDQHVRTPSRWDAQPRLRVRNAVAFAVAMAAMTTMAVLIEVAVAMATRMVTTVATGRATAMKLAKRYRRR